MNIGMMATYPARRQSLLEMLPSVLSQLDRLYVYCNQYKQTDLLELNHWASNHNTGCTVKLIDPNCSEGDVKDMGKFWALGTVEGFVFLLDDDIRYPKDYTQRHINAIHLHRCITTVHGRKIKRYPLTNYFGDTHSFHYRQALKRPQKVHIAGTGTCAFSTDHVPESLYANGNSMLMYQGMADIWFACQARIHELNVICMPRPSSWLTDIPAAKCSVSLYQETKKDNTKHCKTLNKLIWI